MWGALGMTTTDGRDARHAQAVEMGMRGHNQDPVPLSSLLPCPSGSHCVLQPQALLGNWPWLQMTRAARKLGDGPHTWLTGLVASHCAPGCAGPWAWAQGGCEDREQRAADPQAWGWKGLPRGPSLPER